MEAGGSQGTLLQGYAGPRKSCKTPSETPPHGRGSDPAPTPYEGHGAGALWYHLKHPLPSKSRNGILLPVLEKLWSIPELHQSRKLPEPGVGDGHKINKTPLLFLAYPKGFTVGVQKEAGDPWSPPG